MYYSINHTTYNIYCYREQGPRTTVFTYTAVVVYQIYSIIAYSSMTMDIYLDDTAGEPSNPNSINQGIISEIYVFKISEKIQNF